MGKERKRVVNLKELDRGLRELGRGGSGACSVEEEGSKDERGSNKGERNKWC
jgi:hypothetical protein